MKNILIATDFTPASNNAAMYAVELAKHFNAKVHLFNTFEYPHDRTLLSSPVNLVNETKEWLIAEAELINKDGKVHVHMSAEEGPAAETIIKQAHDIHADVIVCAMKEKAKGLKKIFGSVTSSLINKTDIPLIVVPSNVSFKKPEHIALALDKDPSTSPVTLQQLKNIGEQFFSKLYIVNALDENYKEEDVIKFNPPTNTSEITHLRPTYEFRVGDNTASTIHSFAKEKGIDMLAIIPHKHTRMERLLTESVTKSLVFKTDLPVLVLPQKIAGKDEEKVNMQHLEKIWKGITEEHSQA
ncbi:MAG: universal stress protein [Bacteroidetes bacterium]|nr:universal stress protein [Bacteroidota bacterium]